MKKLEDISVTFIWGGKAVTATAPAQAAARVVTVDHDPVRGQREFAVEFARQGEEDGGAQDRRQDACKGSRKEGCAAPQGQRRLTPHRRCN